jgi:hypothetical protein
MSAKVEIMESLKKLTSAHVPGPVPTSSTRFGLDVIGDK